MTHFDTVDAYIASFPKDVQAVLRRIRITIKRALPVATERISYNIATFRLERDVIHVGAFKTHIGLYPPVRDAKLQTRLRRYQGQKGNLQFPLDEPMPYDLIAEIAKSQAQRIKPKNAPSKKRKKPTKRSKSKRVTGRHK
jgi:uncharacterized protein YdhG (YjbR/CyaY superfamily)